jgi:hypothetical protein
MLAVRVGAHVLCSIGVERQQPVESSDDGADQADEDGDDGVAGAMVPVA